MIELIIKSYLTLILSISCGCILLFILGLIFIFRKIGKSSSTILINNTVEEIQFEHEKPLADFLKQKLDNDQGTNHLPNVPEDRAPHSSESPDFSAFAGDNLISTQLDLARAYVETGKKILAKKILQDVLQQGNPIQKQEAQQLLHFIANNLCA